MTSERGPAAVQAAMARLRISIVYDAPHSVLIPRDKDLDLLLADHARLSALLRRAEEATAPIAVYVADLDQVPLMSEFEALAALHTEIAALGARVDTSEPADSPGPKPVLNLMDELKAALGAGKETR